MTGERGDEPDEGEPEETELDRFRDLARKLVRVPKREIDAERAKEKERKEKERRT